MNDNTLLHLAGCVITNKTDKILLIHRNTADWQHWEVPGGKIEEGETAAAAAIRELKEELGIDVEIVKLIAEKAFIERGKYLHYVWFEARISKGKPKIMEPATFDSCKYHDFENLRSGNIVLSTGLQNFLGIIKADPLG